MSRLGDLQEFCWKALHSLQQTVISVARKWIPDFQELDLAPGRIYENVAETLELDIFISEFWDC